MYLYLYPYVCTCTVNGVLDGRQEPKMPTLDEVKLELTYVEISHRSCCNSSMYVEGKAGQTQTQTQTRPAQDRTGEKSKFKATS